MKVECTAQEVMVENLRGNDIPSVRVTCSRCGHTTSSYGIMQSSINRCLLLLRQQCPEGENNFYFVEEQQKEKPSWWSETPPRGKEVETPAVLRNLPLKPPGRT